MFSKLPTRLVIITIGLLVVVYLGLWYWQNFLPPQNIAITDVTQKSAALTWTTYTPNPSVVYYSPNQILIKLLPLTLPWVQSSRSEAKLINHRLILENLSPSKTYYFTISHDLHYYHVQNYRSFGLEETASSSGRVSVINLPVIKTLAKAPDDQLIKIQGVVLQANSKKIFGALVRLNLIDGRAFSTNSDQKGFFVLNVPETANNPVFITAQNGPRQNQAVAVPWSLIKQPIVVKLP